MGPESPTLDFSCAYRRPVGVRGRPLGTCQQCCALPWSTGAQLARVVGSHGDRDMRGRFSPIVRGPLADASRLRPPASGTRITPWPADAPWARLRTPMLRHLPPVSLAAVLAARAARLALPSGSRESRSSAAPQVLVFRHPTAALCYDPTVRRFARRQVPTPRSSRGDHRGSGLQVWG